MKIIKLGDKGIKIKIIQSIIGLKNDIEIDGIFGVDTEKNIKIFQKNNKLKNDGIVGPATLDLLLYTLKNHIIKIFEEV